LSMISAGLDRPVERGNPTRCPAFTWEPRRESGSVAKQAAPSQDVFDRLLRATHALREEWASVELDYPSTHGRAFARLNAFLRAYSTWLKALENAGHDAAAAEFRQSICDAMSKRVPRKISKGERRALVASVLYREGYRLPIAGEKDSRMQAAMAAADVFINTSSEVGGDATADEWQAAFLRNYAALRDAQADDYERVRKDIARFKRSMRGQELYRFNPESLQFERVARAEAIHGLKTKPGRPAEQR